MRKIQSSNSGYFTVEAVLILPIALAIILLVMQIWFFRYNRVLQETDTSAVLVRVGHMQELKPDEKVSYVVSEMQNRYRDKYMAWNFGEIQTSLKNGQIICSVSGSSGFSPGWLSPWGDRAESYAVTSRKRNLVSEQFVIRSYRKLLGVNEKINEYSGE